jgi:hypothetical protein
LDISNGCNSRSNYRGVSSKHTSRFSKIPQTAQSLSFSHPKMPSDLPVTS